MQATPFTERGRVWGLVIAGECNYQIAGLDNKKEAIIIAKERSLTTIC